ncbi:hypothetical protein Golax_010962, partial [Gossypium laxum]|nr:hypothetical protein [Gossypium laxum]
QLSLGADTISANQSLSGNQTIVSSGENFVLGFFTPGKSSNYYIGIWYGGKVSEQTPVWTPVWVANREIPVRDIYSSELKVSDGNLGLFNESQVPIWSTNISSSNSTSVVAVLEDTGNLLLRDAPNSSTPLRGTNQYLILWNRTESFWASGPWAFIRTKTESYFTYSLYNLYNPDTISRFAMDITGCVRKTKLQCDNASNRSCTAYAYEDNHCSIWIGDLLSLKQLGQDDITGKTLYIKMMDSNISNESSSTNRKRVIVIAIAFSVGLLLVGLMILAIMKGRTQISLQNRKKVHSWSLDTEIYTGQPRNSLKNWEKGAFGTVFRGTLPDGSTIAVKKLESINQGEKQFRAEVNTIGKINHINLVRLRGFCLEGSRKLLPENILLDVDNCSKLADFGLANLLGREFSRVLSTTRGTVSYLAPEWISGVAITPKADVYSFGMMILELVSGRRNSEQTVDEEGTFFPLWAARQVNEGTYLRKLLDNRLNVDANLEELSRTCKLACWCIQDNEIQRPSMCQVVQILEGVMDVSLPHIPRFLQEISNDEEHWFLLTDSTISVSSKA